jgi:hypothetical protein
MEMMLATGDMEKQSLWVCESRGQEGIVYWRLGQRQWMMCLDSGLRDQQAATVVVP